ncbi:mitochondrial small ribosomal subunit Rsm22-domain-containing protein [Podospora appendiculata]|uniref:Mitochondrial small ribosomal subunit Rsm22-domain-containing protein n=1 Tax=Podospora appendiculata TaxID=314037 RepID=A0AAE0XHQ3_9PEZI|nr:mitochondrial small ribosomal subunit Rsm22-domain-containing protein [Podospora appendiculata]
MISAGKFQNRCPGCRAQILGFYDALLLPHSRSVSRPFHHASSRSAAPAAGSASRPPRAAPIRQFSSTRPTFQGTQPSQPAPEPRKKDVEIKAEDSETIVRQARQTFGHTLPPNYLSPEEYQLYERLYGPPLRETRPEDVGIPYHGESGEIFDGSPTNALLRETEHGTLEEVEYIIDRSTARADEAADEIDGAIEVTDDADALETVPPLTDAQVDYMNVTANNHREYHALMKLQQDFEAASVRPLEEIEEEEPQEEVEEEEQDDEDDGGEPDATFAEPELLEDRLHENTVLGQSKTTPSTLHLPKKNMVQPILELLRRTDIKHVKEAAERVFGGPGLPHSPATPVSKRNFQQKPIAMEAGHHRISEIEADAYIATVLPGVYACVMSTLVETRRRLGADWLRGLLAREDGKGPRVLDVGGAGAGLLAWQEILQAEWETLREKGEVEGREPPCKKTMVVGSNNLRHRVSRFLENTTFLPRLPDYIHSVEGSERQLDAGEDGPAGSKKVFDVIIASHLQMPIEKPFKRKALLDNLWTMLSPEGGVLIVIEKGHPRGFEAVADVRQRLLDEFIIAPTPTPHPEEILTMEPARVREPGMIIAPCTTHHKCPMYLTPGLSAGRKDFCHFSQRFIRPSFLQRVHGASHRNHEDIDFSYIAVRRGVHPDGTIVSPNDPAAQFHAPPFLQGKEATDLAFAGYESSDVAPPHPFSLPRNVRPPLKRHGHVTLDVCTPAGALERWTVPRSFSKQAYHDARKSQWGDLWALGAKTRTRRDIRLGRAAAANATILEGLKNAGDGGVRSRALDLGGKRKKPSIVDLQVDPRHGMVGATERYPGGRAPIERRTKGGRLVRIKDLMEDMGVDEMEDPLDEEDAEIMRGAAKLSSNRGR